MLLFRSCFAGPSIEGQATEMVPSTGLAQASSHHGWQKYGQVMKKMQTSVRHDLFLIGCCCLGCSQATKHEMACQVASFQQLKPHGQTWLGQNLSPGTNLTYLIWTVGVLSLRLNQSSRSREWLAACNAMEKMCQTDKTPTQGTSGRDTPVTRVTRISCAKYILCWVEVAKFRLWTPGVYIHT